MDIFNVDILNSMQSIRCTWTEFLKIKTLNCWRHIRPTFDSIGEGGIFSDVNKDSAHLNSPIDQLLPRRTVFTSQNLLNSIE